MEENIHDLLVDDRRLSVSEICQVRLTYGSCQAIITNSLGFCKLCARWTPHLLTEQQKLARLKFCERHSNGLQRKEMHFLITLSPVMKLGFTTTHLNQIKPVMNGERRVRQLQ